MLHLIMSSPTMLDMAHLERLIGEKDDVLLLQDGVYGGIAGNLTFSSFLAKRKTSLYLLKEDSEARGITALIDDNFTIIDYQQFVAMTVKHSKQITW
ncbi:sulfurtransferase complex subunit TusB [Tatumella sp. TA1]|nr:sulfurtransferase complex subunit TusB [Tatumella sp. TA1]